MKKLTTAFLVILLSIGQVWQLSAQNEYTQRFLDLREKMNDPSNGYFSPDGVPYHSVETLMAEAPDHGHETTSEAYSYWIWMETMYGGITGDWSYLNDAWTIMENTAIPSSEQQPTTGDYNPSSPASYAREFPLPDFYPAPLETSVPVGEDPVSAELTATYGSDIYAMHWLFDCDNFYGYGNMGDGVSTPSYINTFQRGEQESVWETVPHPSWEDFSWGADDGTGFLKLFIDDGDTPAAQWRYTNAPDADARAVQAIYWAIQFAKEQGLEPESALPVAEASKMGDFVRLSMFDKYFKPLGAQDKNAPGATGYESAHYLMSWYFAWGGPLESQGWSWRIGSSHSHFGYQNPMAAYALSQVDELIPISTNGARDWGISMDRMLEFYNWLQSEEGAIAGGATNSYNGDYEAYPAGTGTFYDMAYQVHPVYRDPGSNQWIGMQAWSMERVAEVYYATNNPMAKRVLDRWVPWIKSEVQLLEDGDFNIPATLSWEGQPNVWNPANPGINTGLHVEVTEYGKDLGIAACLAKALIYYAAATEKHETLDTESRDLAKEILDRMWNNYYDEDGLGVAVEETRGDFSRFFDQEVFVPEGFSGTMANGDVIEPGVTFIDIRSKYRDDPDFPALEAAYNAGEDFVNKYHRYWAQADIALANAEYGRFFGGEGEPIAVTGVTVNPSTLTISVGGSEDLTPVFSPLNATNKNVTWSSGDETLASVDANGLVTGLALGVVDITVTTEDGGFTAVAQVTVSELPTYMLTTAVVGDGSITLDPTGGVYDEGTEVTLTATAAEGYSFEEWSGDATGTATTLTVMMDQNLSIVANFAQDQVPGCEVETAISMPFVLNGAGEFCFVASGTVENFNSWNMDLIEINGQDFTNLYGSSYPPSEDGNIHIRYVSLVPWSHFEINGTDGQTTQYNLSSSVLGQGSVTPATGTFAEGTVVDLTATPSTGWEFSEWGGDASGTSPTTSITMDSNKEVVATFTEIVNPQEYVLTTSVVGLGSITPDSGTFTEGAVVDLIATAAEGYEFSGWSGDATGTSSTTSVTMDSNKEVVATFIEIVDPQEYTLTTSVVGQGSITPDEGIFTEGTIVDLTATAADGYEFVSWSGDASGTSGSVSITMDSDKVITASFEEIIGSEFCESPDPITLPFVQNGSGDFCFVTTQVIGQINNWNMTSLTINGVDFTNTWANSFPAAVDGEWVIEYQASVAWAHFEASAASGARQIESVTAGMDTPHAKIYPNPFTNEIAIDFEDVSSIGSITILDHVGRKVLAIDQVDISSHMKVGHTLKAGLYFITVQYRETHETYKIMKN